MIRLQGSGVAIEREEWLTAFSGSTIEIALRNWPFASGMHFGSRVAWIADADDERGHRGPFECFGHAWIEAHEFLGVDYPENEAIAQWMETPR